MRSGRVTTEGDDLYYEVRGQGHPLLLIPGGGGDADRYTPLAELLADEYKVITYDRRANARSTMHDPRHFTIERESRDAVAVLRAAGETSAFVFGNSSGAVIALDLALTQPQAVRAVVAHEPPLARLHPRADHWQRFFVDVLRMSDRWGSSIATLKFLFGIEVPVWQLITAGRAGRSRERGSEPRVNPRAGNDYFIKQELLPVTNYLPDVARLKLNGVPVYPAAGSWAMEREKWLAVVARLLAEQLGSELVVLPGHHGSYMDRPVEWAAALRAVLHKAV
jgi:pimeloyl-ACP methyl ester carboxylesterase